MVCRNDSCLFAFGKNLKKFITTVEPHFMDTHFMDTHLVQTPHYYGRVSLSLGKLHRFSLNSTGLIPTPINVDNRQLLFLGQ